MKGFYLYILIGSGIIPLLFSIFGIDFIKKWKKFFISTSIVAAVFIVWDVFFTKAGVWGFNTDYYLERKFLELPIEEWLFFFIIPFCSIFTHYAIFYALPDLKLHKKISVFLSVCILAISVVLAVMHSSNAYTFVNFVFVAAITLIAMVTNKSLLQRFYISFLVVLIPFFLVNGLLTGIATESPVVWYDNTQNLAIRLWTIPVEDIGYAFSMLLGNLLIFEKLKQQ